MPPDLVSNDADCASGDDGDSDGDGDGDSDGKGKGDGDGDGDSDGDGDEAGNWDGSGFDDLTDTARANAAKLGRDYAMCGAVAGPGIGGTFCDEGTVSGVGDVTDYVDKIPEIGDAIGNANPKAMRVCDRSKFTRAGGAYFVSIFCMIPGATLIRLAWSLY